MLYLLVVAIMEGAVGNTQVGLQIVSVRILLVALKESQSRDEISLLQEMSPIWKLLLFL